MAFDLYIGKDMYTGTGRLVVLHSRICCCSLSVGAVFEIVTASFTDAGVTVFSDMFCSSSCSYPHWFVLR